MKRRTLLVGTACSAVGMSCTGWSMPDPEKGVGEAKDPPSPSRSPSPAPSPAEERTGKVVLREEFEGYPRKSLLYIPPATEGVKSPLAIIFHGGGKGNVDVMYTRNKLRDLCHQRGWIGLFPEMDLPDTAEDRRGDFNYSNHVLRKVLRRSNVDRSRVYAIGFSGGGKKAYAHAAKNSDLISAIAVSSTKLGQKGDDETWSPTVNKAKRVSVLHMHGGRDTNTPLEGGPNHDRKVNYIGMMEGLKVWADHNGCEPADDSRPGSCPRRVKTVRWSSDSGYEVLGLIDPELKHQWPSWANETLATFLEKAPRRS